MLVTAAMSRETENQVETNKENTEENIYVAGAIQKVHPYRGRTRAFKRFHKPEVEEVKTVSLEDYFFDTLEKEGLFDLFVDKASAKTCVKVWNLWLKADRRNTTELMNEIRRMLK